MNRRFVGVLAFAFIVAAFSSLILYRVLNARFQALGTASRLSRIILANRNLEPGTVLKAEDIQLADWPGQVPTGAGANLRDFIGRGVTTPIYAREPVIESRLALRGAGGGLAAMIPKGMRAVAVRVNEVVGVAGFVVPGRRVDVLISGSAPGTTGNLGTLTRTLLQNVEVLSAGQDFKRDAEGKPVVVQVVNLLATPEQAEQLSLAVSQTQIQLVLRNPLDRDEIKTRGTALAYLFATPGAGVSRVITRDSPPGGHRPSGGPPAVRHDPAPLPVAGKDAPFVMEIVAGTKKTQQTFENKDGEVQ